MIVACDSWWAAQVRFRVGIINKQQGKHDEALLVSVYPIEAWVPDLPCLSV